MAKEYQDVYLDGKDCLVSGKREKIAEKIGAKGSVFLARETKDLFRAVSNRGIKYIVLNLEKRICDISIFRKAKENKKVFFVPFREFLGRDLNKKLRYFREIILFEQKTGALVYLVNFCKEKEKLERRNFEYFMSFFGRNIRREIK